MRRELNPWPSTCKVNVWSPQPRYQILQICRSSYLCEFFSFCTPIIPKFSIRGISSRDFFKNSSIVKKKIWESLQKFILKFRQGFIQKFVKIFMDISSEKIQEFLHFVLRRFFWGFSRKYFQNSFPWRLASEIPTGFLSEFYSGFPSNPRIQLENYSGRKDYSGMHLKYSFQKIRLFFF